MLGGADDALAMTDLHDLNIENLQETVDDLARRRRRAAATDR
jgi:hypothetical protein